MVRLYPFIGSRKNFTITFATPRENLQGTPTTLPTTEPADPQVQYTVLTSDLPTLTPKPYSHKLIAVVYAAGKFTSFGTVYWRMVKNGSSVATGSSVMNSDTFYTVNAWFLDVVPGDVLGIKLWSSKTDSNWDYDAIFVYPTRLQPFNLLNKKLLLTNARFYNENATYPTLTLGNPLKWITNYPFRFYAEDPVDIWMYTTFDYTITYWSPNPTYGVWRIAYYGDGTNANTATVQTDATYRPKYYSNYIRAFLICRTLRVE